MLQRGKKLPWVITAAFVAVVEIYMYTHAFYLRLCFNSKKHEHALVPHNLTSKVIAPNC